MRAATRAARVAPAAILAAACVGGASALLVSGCDVDGGPEQRVDPRAKPPPGWVSLANRSGRFTFAAPRDWLIKRRAREISVTSPTLATIVVLRADRSPAGQRTPASRYAFEILSELPGFEGRIVRGPANVPGSSYGNARVSAFGRVAGSPRRERVSVVALRVPDQVVYVATVYGAADARTADQIIRSIRSGLGQSGRSG